MENMEENCEKIRKIWKKAKLNSEKICKIQKKIVKWYGKYGRKVGIIVKWYGKYGRKVGWIVKWYGKHGSKLWNDMKYMENIEDFFFFFTNQLKLHVIYLSLHYALQ
jgi:hypothetical protein